MEVADAVSYLGYSVIAKTIVDQCNLLLETKKKKCNHGVRFLKDSETGKITDWTICKQCKPSPQPEIGKLDFSKEPNKKFSKFIPSVTDVLIMTKLNEVIDQLNKLTKTK